MTDCQMGKTWFSCLFITDFNMYLFSSYLQRTGSFKLLIFKCRCDFQRLSLDI